MSQLWTWHPPVGVYIAVLGVLGILVPFFRDITKIEKGEKALWTLVMVVLVLLEIKSIYQDRNEHDREQADARAEQLKQFSDIASRMDKSLEESEASRQRSDEQFEATIDRTNKIFGEVGDSMKMQTGGDSFAYITFTQEPGYVQFNQFSNPSGPWFLVSITSHGKYPLKEIHATLMDDERRRAAMDEYNKHPDGDWLKAINSGDTHYQYPYLRPQSPNRPSGDVEPIGAYPIPQGNSERLSIAFSSLNGDWIETLHLGLVNGTWRQCLSILGPTVTQAAKPFVYCEPEWPEGRALAEGDWSRPKR